MKSPGKPGKKKRKPPGNIWILEASSTLMGFGFKTRVLKESNNSTATDIVLLTTRGLFILLLNQCVYGESVLFTLLWLKN